MTMQPRRLFPEMQIGDKIQEKSIKTKPQHDKSAEQDKGMGF